MPEIIDQVSAELELHMPQAQCHAGVVGAGAPLGTGTRRLHGRGIANAPATGRAARARRGGGTAGSTTRRL